MFKGLGSLANIGSMLRQAQEMGGRLKEVTEQLRSKRATGSSGGGMIEVEVNGLGEALSIRIDPDLFAKQDREMIEDLVPAAVNQALGRARQMHAEMMKQLTAGFELPGLDDALSHFTGHRGEAFLNDGDGDGDGKSEGAGKGPFDLGSGS